MALFGLAGFAYSLKLGWSPIVDAHYLRGFRRRSWIISMQILVGLLLIYFSLVDLLELSINRLTVLIIIAIDSMRRIVVMRVMHKIKAGQP